MLGSSQAETTSVLSGQIKDLLPTKDRKRGLSDFTKRFHAINITFLPFHL
jgi:hypothetical protein